MHMCAPSVLVRPQVPALGRGMVAPLTGRAVGYSDVHKNYTSMFSYCPYWFRMLFDLVLELYEVSEAKGVRYGIHCEKYFIIKHYLVVDRP